MTLKELRESKGLTQAKVAKYLGMSTRSYQNYENNEAKWSTSKYCVIYRRLDAYLPTGPREYFFSESDSFLTGIVIGKGLRALYRTVENYEKRDCYSLLKKYIEGNYDGKICILYGLRRTGKTTMLFQMIGELPMEKTAYIKMKPSDNMSLLAKDLRKLYQSGYRYVFIDEIT